MSNLLLIFSEYVFDFDIIELDLDDVEEDEGLDLKKSISRKNLSDRKMSKFPHCDFLGSNSLFKSKGEFKQNLIHVF